MINDFLLINDEFLSLEERGYRLVYNAYCQSDRELELKVCDEKSIDYVSRLYREFNDGCYLPICMGADNLLYAVVFLLDSSGERKPLLWKQVQKAYIR